MPISSADPSGDQFWREFLERWGYPSGRAFAARAVELRRAERASWLNLHEGVSDEEWALVTDCAPWTVRDLATHIAAGDAIQLASVETGLGVRGTRSPSYEELLQLHARLVARPTPEILETGRQNGDAFEGRIAGLSEEELWLRASHRMGMRPIWWFAAHRLLEVWFHHWDAAQALGRGPDSAPEVAPYLLPLIVELNMPPVYLRGPRGRIRFGVTASDDRRFAWILAGEPERLKIEAAEAPAQVRLRADAGTLARMLYGREKPTALLKAGRVEVTGDVSRLSEINTLLAGA